MDVSLLPLELIEEVTKYLSAEDVVSCSMVNRQWRKVFNNDRIWDRFYTFHKKYFKKQVTKRRNDSKSFFDSSKSRKHVLRELQVEKNLIEGQFQLTQASTGRFYCDNLVDMVDADGNHWLFISCSLIDDGLFYHRIKVWNMNNDEPVKLGIKETSLVSSEEFYDSQMNVFQNKLYYLVKNVCLAFEFGSPEYELKFLFEVTCPKYRQFRGHTAMVCTPNMVLGFIHSSTHFQQSAEPWVHVWGEDSSLLYKSYSNSDVDEMQAHMVPAENEGFFSRFSTRMVVAVKDGGSSSSDNVLLVCNCTSGRIPVMLVSLFDVRTFQFTTLFVKKLVKFLKCEFVNNLVVVFYYAGRTLNTQSGPKLICFSTDGNVIYEPELRYRPCVLTNNVFTTNEGKEVVIVNATGVTVFDVFERKEICTFKIRPSTGKYCGTFIKDNLLMVKDQRRWKIVLSVWDFKVGKHLYDVDHFPSRTPRIIDYKYAFIRSFRSPPKIFALRETLCRCPTRCEGDVLTISFL